MMLFHELVKFVEFGSLGCGIMCPITLEHVRVCFWM
jgi:hypothetical protein